MSQSGLLRRYLIFLAGVLCSALGISLITLAGMGTSAVSSLAYVLTYVFPGISLGTFTFVVNCVMLGGQILILRKKFRPIQLLQVPFTFLFSCCIDLWMGLLGGLVPQSYASHWVILPTYSSSPARVSSGCAARNSTGTLARPRLALT